MLKIPLKYIKISNSNLYRKNKEAIVIIQGLSPQEVLAFEFIESLKTQVQIQFSKEEDFLLSNYNVYIFPVVCIDGFLFGNSFCNLAGLNLNSPDYISKYTTPEIYQLIRELQRINSS